jgi:hypothetical protein
MLPESQQHAPDIGCVDVSDRFALSIYYNGKVDALFIHQLVGIPGALTVGSQVYAYK